MRPPNFSLFSLPLVITVSLLLLFSFAPAALAQTAPSISSINPTLGPVGTPVTVTGQNFGATQGSSSASFNATQATPTSWSDTSIRVPVPNSLAAGNLSITVTVNGVASNSVAFTLIPVITQLSVYSGAPGAQVTITGSGFGDTQSASTVAFNGIFSQASSWSNSSIVTSVPAGASTGPLVVTVNSLATNSVNFTVPTPAPIISSLSPGMGPIGTSVTIAGSNFGDTQGSSRVLFPGLQGSPPSSPTSWSATLITVPVPTGAITGGVGVAVNGQVSNFVRFVVGTLNVSGISPSSGAPGATVTVSGSGFGATQGTSAVTFNGTQATPTSWSDTQIVAPVPAGATTGPVNVTVNGFVSNGGNGPTFTVNAPPVVSSISPVSGGIGAAVILSGTLFGVSQGQSTVTFNGIAAKAKNWNDSSITVAVPSGLSPGTATVTVTRNQLASNGVQFTVTQPLFITPNQVTMFAGDTRPIQLLDGNGVVINGMTWTFDDSSIAEIVPPANPGDPLLLQADAAGSTNLLASFGDRTGNAKVTVFAAGTSLPIGTVQWSVPSLGSFGISNSVQSLRIDDNTPDLYIEDDGALGGNGSIRALTADGQQKWIWPNGANRSPTLLAADDQGGAIYDALNNDQVTEYLGHLDENGNETWRHQLPNSFSDWGIGPDGTVYILQDQDAQTSFVTALDPATGQVKFTVPVPYLSQLASQNYTNLPDPNAPNPDQTSVPFCTPGTFYPPGPGAPFEHGRLAISSDGTVYLPFTSVSTLLDAEPCDSTPDPQHPGYTHRVDTSLSSWSTTANLYVLVIQPDGSSSSQSLDTRSDSRTNWADAFSPQYDASSTAVPDGQGGALLPVETSLYHVGSGAKFSLPFTASVHRDALLLGEDGTAYVVGSPDGSNNTVAALDTSSGAVKWTATPGICCVSLSTVTADGKVAFSYFQNDFSGHLGIADATGQASPLFSASDGSDAGPVAPAFHSERADYWSLGTWHASLPDGSVAAITGPFVDLEAVAYTEAGGNSQAQHTPPRLACDCLVQSTDPTPVAQPAPSLNCPICNLQPPSCTSTAGDQSTYLILVGDSGINAGVPGHNHNVGNLFNLSAQTQANSLQAQGHHVIACRVSSIQHVSQALTANGPIDGGIIYFGHAGWVFSRSNLFWYSVLAAGQQTGDDTNVSFLNVGALSNAQIGPNATMTINSCNAGLPTPSRQPPIAQLIANQLRRTVLAYRVGTYFNQNPDDMHFSGAGQPNPPNSLPMYMLPMGRAPKPSPITFSPQ